jgi:hypothetical protein
VNDLQTSAATQTAPEALHKATTDPHFVDVPAITFLMIDGAGDPNASADYRDAIAALYALSYALKFAVKKAGGGDYRVAPLEGLWWAEDPAAFSMERKQNWQWTMMIAQPAAVTPALLDTIRMEVRRKKALPALDRVRLASLVEGRAAQVLHRGPYETEGPTIERLHRFIREHGADFDGRAQKHHEIYLSDPTRTTPERMRTVVRQPIV